MGNPVTELLQLVSEVEADGCESSDPRWIRIRELDTEIALKVGVFPNIEQTGGDRRVGFCQIPVTHTFDGIHLWTKGEGACALNWQQAMRVLELRFPVSRDPRQSNVWEKVKPALSTLHFDADGNFIDSPRELKKIAELAGIKTPSLDYTFRAKLYPGDKKSTAAEKYHRSISGGEMEQLLRADRGEGKAFGTCDPSVLDEHSS
jgi:hypothetical protein